MWDIFNGELKKYEGKEKVIIIPDGVERIGDFAFYNCDHLEKVVFTDQVTSIGRYAFYGCDALNEIVLPKTITHIDQGAFSYCQYLTKVEIQAPISTLSESLFYRCTRLKGVLLPDTVETISKQVFGFCQSLEELHLPMHLKHIGEGAFEQCLSLKQVQLPKYVITIGKKAFYHCPSLQKLELSVSLEEVGESAFETHGTLSFISNETLCLKPIMFDDHYHLSFQNRSGHVYDFVKSYMPHLVLEEWKEEAKIVLFVNYLETRENYTKESFYETSYIDYKKGLLEFLIDNKRYEALNKALEIGWFSSIDIEPYFEKITDREQKAKIMAFNQQENHSIVEDLEDALMDLF